MIVEGHTHHLSFSLLLLYLSHVGRKHVKRINGEAPARTHQSMGLTSFPVNDNNDEDGFVSEWGKKHGKKKSSKTNPGSREPGRIKRGGSRNPTPLWPAHRLERLNGF